MSVTRGIPPLSDYAHWNEEAEQVWYAENRYDMEHPEVFEEDWDDDPFRGDYEEDDDDLSD